MQFLSFQYFPFFSLSLLESCSHSCVDQFKVQTKLPGIIPFFFFPTYCSGPLGQIISKAEPTCSTLLSRSLFTAYQCGKKLKVQPLYCIAFMLQFWTLFWKWLNTHLRLLFSWDSGLKYSFYSKKLKNAISVFTKMFIL